MLESKDSTKKEHINEDKMIDIRVKLLVVKFL
jgi:hypothetical protein